MSISIDFIVFSFIVGSFIVGSFIDDFLIIGSGELEEVLLLLLLLLFKLGSGVSVIILVNLIGSGFLISIVLYSFVLLILSLLLKFSIGWSNSESFSLS